ncbi:hypothetical protein CB0940_08195 [Cercospora beticola]|uniref:Uncharacterized protein n=1 Tax=Cercospora beticola TaxID=122368 RepID=A0A2G5HQJ9_CERBT|nr:hypothetical protein CB0940_08195 [Cercospora beticola]PIA94799.1 hypothetical protein CB0940_08195 [Cercospora beticola]WPB04762.1 hypothetical protein RHO25_009409 [Cercospora beticola]
MNGQGRQQNPAPVFPPPPREDDHPEQREKMTTGLPNYAYRAMYDNQYPGGYPPPPPKAGSHSNSTNRSQRSAHGAARGRIEDDRFGRPLDDGHYHSERRTRTRDRHSRRRPTSSYDSDRSYDSRESRHHRDDRRRRGDMRSRSRRRSLERDRRDQEVQKNQQQNQQQHQGQEAEKKTGFAKIEEYITPFNVGILMGCMDLIGGSISLYMTNKRFSKKALAKGPAPGEPGSSSGGKDSGDKTGGADKKQDNSGGSKAGSSRSKASSSRSKRARSTGSARNRGREGDLHRERDPYSRRDSSDSDSTGTSYWSRSDTRRYRHMPERLEYDDRGRPKSADARAMMRGHVRTRR